MKRAFGLLTLLILLAVLYWRPSFSASDRQAQPANSSALPDATQPSRPGSSAPPVGDRILEHYASPLQSPERDLISMALLMENYLLLVKNADRRPLSANEDWAAALAEPSPGDERYLSGDHPALNQQGQLVDRWGTPLFFHAVGKGRFDVRSAGPDRQLWTDDDLQRAGDGTLHRGASLEPASVP